MSQSAEVWLRSELGRDFPDVQISCPMSIEGFQAFFIQYQIGGASLLRPWILSIVNGNERASYQVEKAIK